MKKIMARWSFTNSKARIDAKKSDALCMCACVRVCVCVCGIGKESFTKSSSRPVKRLILTRQKLRELGWVLMHSPYNPDLASEYYVFRSLQNSLNGVKLILKEVCENHLSQFFAPKSQKFYEIMVLPQKRAENNRIK